MGKVTKAASINHNFWREWRAEAVGNRRQSRPLTSLNALALGQTGSQMIKLIVRWFSGPLYRAQERSEKRAGAGLSQWPGLSFASGFNGWSFGLSDVFVTAPHSCWKSELRSIQTAPGTSLTLIITLAVADGLFGLYGRSQRRDELFIIHYYWLPPSPLPTPLVPVPNKPYADSVGVKQHETETACTTLRVGSHRGGGRKVFGSFPQLRPDGFFTMKSRKCRTVNWRLG